MYVGDSDGTVRSTVFNNNLHDNGTGLQFDDSIDAYGNAASLNTGIGIQISNGGGNTQVHDNYSIRNATGIQAGTGRVFHNRVVGNSGSGILLNFNAVNVNANTVYGNSVGIEVAALSLPAHLRRTSGRSASSVEGKATMTSLGVVAFMATSRSATTLIGMLAWSAYSCASGLSRSTSNRSSL